MQEPQTFLLWPAGAPGALGTGRSRQAGDDGLHAAEHHRPDDRGDHRARRQLRAPVDEPRRARARQLLQLARHRGVRAALSPRSAVSPSRSSSATRSARFARCGRGRPNGTSRPIASASWGFPPADIWRRARRRTSTPATPDAADPIDRVSSRPDFAVLGYPVISFVEPLTHQGSKTNLLGENSGSRAGAQPVERDAGDRVDAADVHLSHQRRTRPCRRRTRSPTTSRCARPVCRPSCTCSATGRTAPGWGRPIPRSPNGRGCWRTGCASAGF